MNNIRDLTIGGRIFIPATTSQAPSAAGQIAVDTDGDGANHTQGLLKFHDGTRVMNAVALDAIPSTDGHVVTYDGSAKKFKTAAVGSVSADNTWLNNLAGNRVFGHRMIYANGRMDVGIPFDESFGAGSVAYVVPTASLPAYRRVTTSTTINTDGYVYIIAATNNPFYDARSWHFRVVAAINSTADVRMIIGMCASAGYGHFASTLPASSVVFRYDTAAGDTSWKCITKDGTTATTTDSAVPADTNLHQFDIIFDDSTNTYTFYIDGVLKATHTTNLPVASTQSYAVAGVRTLVATAKEFWYTNVLFHQKVLSI